MKEFIEFIEVTLLNLKKNKLQKVQSDFEILERFLLEMNFERACVECERIFELYHSEKLGIVFELLLIESNKYNIARFLKL